MPTTKSDCRHDKADIVFLLDASASEGLSNFQKQLQFVRNFTNNYDIGPNKVQVGLVTFATLPTLGFNLNQYHDKASLLHAIDSVFYKTGGTNTDRALKYVRENSFNATNGGRAGVPKVLVVLTDGQSANPIGTAQEARILHFSNIKTIAIGIGSDVVKAELIQIGSDAQHVFTVPSFDSLQSIEIEIQSAACGLENIDQTSCEAKLADIVFVLDSSGSEGKQNFDKQLQFVSNLTNSFSIGANGTQVSVVTFGTHAYNEFFLNEYLDKASLQRAIHNISYQGGTTNTAEALTLVRTNSFQPQNGGRGGAVTKLVVVLTDGQSNSPTATTAAAQSLTYGGIKVIAVGIGSSLSMIELQHIASDRSHVLSVADFNSLNTISTEIERLACMTPSPCGDKPADIVFVLDASSSEGADNFQKQLDFVTNFVNQFDIGPSDVQVGLVTFGSTAHSEFYLNAYSDKNSLIAAIQSVRYSGGTASPSAALRFVSYYQFTTTHGARVNASHTVIVLTDGHADDPSATISEAMRLKNINGAQIIVIGIGAGVNQFELNAMATDRSHVFTIGSFSILHTLQTEVKDQACGAPKPKPVASTDCGHQPADIVFLLDSSASEGAENFKKQVDFVRDFVYQFTIGPNDVQVSVIVFSSSAHEQFPLNRYHNQADLLYAIAHITFNSGVTYTDKALFMARNQSFLASKGARPNARDLVILLTDGQSTYPTRTATEADLLKNQPNVKVIAIGIGSGVQMTELQRIASDSAHALAVADFNSLNAIQSEVTFVACQTCSFVNKADIVFALDASSSEGALNFHSQLDFVSRVANDFTVGVNNVQIGCVTFSDNAHLEFNLNQYHDKSSLLAAIQKVAYTQGITHTDEALQFIRQRMFTAAAGDRGDANNYVIVLTDGASTDRNATIQAANLLKQRNVVVIAIGIGSSINNAELNAIASDPRHVFTVSDFNSLRTLKSDIKAAACEEVQSTTAASPVHATTS